MHRTSLLLSCFLSLAASPGLWGVLPSPDGSGGVSAVEAPESCDRCGMDRARFARSRMLILRKDGSRVGTCSLHCAAEVIGAAKKSPVRTLRVADQAHPLDLLEARSAVWVIGGDLPGVMTGTATWAFVRSEDAQAFIRRHGGRAADFDEALRRVRQEGSR